jgi:23S rRNA (adenine2503-C2)-methyltransferase
VTRVEPGSDLGRLSTILHGRKLAVARRLVLSGQDMTVDALIARGAQPTEEERVQLEPFRLQTTVVERVAAEARASRLVVRLADGEQVESVVLGDGGVCVSSQVGCAVGCRFCASGIGGLRRQLSAVEILEQVAHARAIDAGIKRVVYMGIGEPSHNLEAVLEAALVLAEDGGVHERSQTLSTVGSTRAFRRMTESEVRPSVALSLHAADDALRRDLLPRAGQEPVADLVAAAEAYADATGREIQYAWALLDGVNDRECDVDALVALLSGKRGYVNVIPWNPVPELPFATPHRTRALGFVKALRDRGLFATVRWSTGVEAEAACGQLRRRRAAVGGEG